MTIDEEIRELNELEHQQNRADWFTYVGLLFVVFVSAIATYGVCKTKWQVEAVKAGHAEWKTDKNGYPDWSWK